MEMQEITSLVTVALIPLGIYLYHAYVKATTKDSPVGRILRTMR